MDSGSHSKNLLCHNARKDLDEINSCRFCKEKHSNLSDHFDESVIDN